LLSIGKGEVAWIDRMTLTSSLGRWNIIGLYVWPYKILEDILLRPEAAVSIFRIILGAVVRTLP
jgi:hypothetical protein